MNTLKISFVLFLLSIFAMQPAGAQNIETKPCEAADVPTFEVTFPNVQATDVNGQVISVPGSSTFESDAYFMYEKQKDGRFTTYLLNAEEYCMAEYMDGKLHKLSMSVFLWDTPVERLIHLYFDPRNEVEKVAVSYPKEDKQISEHTFSR